MATGEDVYLTAIVFLSESFIQWMCYYYLNLNVFFDDSAACLLIFIAGLTFIMIHRFLDCCYQLVWVQAIFAFCLVEFVIIGTSQAITAPVLELTVCVMAVLLQVSTFSFIGAHLAKTSIVHFVGLMCLWVFLCLISCVLALTIMLSIQWQVTYTNVFVMTAYPAILFSVSYESRLINSFGSDNSMRLGDCLRFGLFLYGEFVLLLVLSLILIKPQTKDD